MNKYKGFTLVELLVVIGLMAILLVLALSGISKNKAKTRDNIRISDINNIRLALEQYRLNCGVFPATLELSANNGRTGNCSSTLGDFIPEIPTAPERDGTPLIAGTSIVLAESNFNGYFYAGLSTALNGPCYEYHVGAELEFATTNGYDESRALKEDHDYLRNAAPYIAKCSGSGRDIGSVSNTSTDNKGFYDFRSTNNS